MINNLSHIFDRQTVRYAFDHKGYSNIALVAKDGTTIKLYSSIVREYSRFKVLKDIFEFNTHYLYINIISFI